MEVKKGYKKTIMGEIPSDWHLCEFSEVMDGFTSGQTPYRANKKYYTGKIPWITSGELNYNTITDTNEKITEEAVRNTGLKIIPKGTFLFAITGLEAEGTRGSCAITGIDAATNQSCMALYPKKNKLITLYLYQYYLRHGKDLALKYCQGTKQQSFTAKIAKSLPIILPSSIKEQERIVKVLQDVDELVFDLERMLNKKRAIKIGTMQLLLTGKSRLPGFTEIWQTKELKELLTYEQPVKYIVKSSEYNQISGTPVLTANKSFILGYTDETNGVFRNVPVIIFDDFTTASKYVSFSFKVKSSAIKILRPKNNQVNLRFVYEKIQLIQFSLGDHKRYYISEYQKNKIDIPSIEEQDAVSQVISNMESEIEQLEEKLIKYKQIKSGLMHQLLTGQKRLS